MSAQLGFEIFDSRGHFVMPTEEQAATLDDAARERLDTVKVAYEASAQADADLKAAQDQVTALAAELRDAEEYVKAHFPAMTHAALVKDWIKSERAAKYL
jgi:hypothetical protein